MTSWLVRKPALRKDDVTNGRSGGFLSKDGVTKGRSSGFRRQLKKIHRSLAHFPFEFLGKGSGLEAPQTYSYSLSQEDIVAGL